MYCLKIVLKKLLAMKIHFAIPFILLCILTKSNAQVPFETLYSPIEQQIASGIIRSQDGGYLVASGGLHRSDGDAAMLSRFSVNGDHQWTRTYLYPILVANGLDVAQDSNGDIYMLSEHSQIHFRDIKLQKFNINGSLLWDTLVFFSHDTMPDINSDREAKCLTVGLNDEVLFGGWGHADSLQKASVTCIRSDGTFKWFNHYLETESSIVNRIIPTKDSCYVLNCSNANAAKMSVIKIDSMGDVLWQRNHDLTSTFKGRSIAEKQNGNVLVFSTKAVGNGDFYPEILEYSPDGDSVSVISFSSLTNEFSSSIQVIEDTAYMLMTNDLEAVEMYLSDTLGNIIAHKSHGEEYYDPGYDPVNGNSMVHLNDYYYAFAGFAFEQKWKIYVVVDSFFPDTSTASIKEQDLSKVVVNYTDGTVRIENDFEEPLHLSVYNLMGQQLIIPKLISAHSAVHFPVSNLSTQILIVRLVNDTGTTFSRKIMVP